MKIGVKKYYWLGLSVLAFILLAFSCSSSNSDQSKDCQLHDSTSVNQVDTSNATESVDSQIVRPIKIQTAESGVPSHTTFMIKEKALIVIQMDSLEIEQLKSQVGEEDYYTVIDDVMYYESLLQAKCAKDNISTFFTTKDTVDIIADNIYETIVKDSTLDILNYYFFDGKSLHQKDVFELLEYTTNDNQ